MLGLPAVGFGEVAEVTDVAVPAGVERAPVWTADVGLVLGRLTAPCIPVAEHVIANTVEALAHFDPVVVVVSTG